MSTRHHHVEHISAPHNRPRSLCGRLCLRHTITSLLQVLVAFCRKKKNPRPVIRILSGLSICSVSIL
jgi:hypothetical protein